MTIRRNCVSSDGYRNVPEHHAAVLGAILIGNGVTSALVGILDLSVNSNDIRSYNFIAVAAPVWSGIIVSISHTSTS